MSARIATMTLLGLLTTSVAGCEEEPEPAYLPEAEPIADEVEAAPEAERPVAQVPTRPVAPAAPTPRAAPPAPSDVAAPPADAQRTPSGLASKVLQPGTGTRHPAATNTVQVHYTGWRAENGEMFDSSLTRGEPASFPLNRVIAGWTEGVQLMVEGERRRLWIPENLAYGGRPGAPAGMLVFDVELIRIVD
jgi:FKBP-type peptidyl-prolyl cis-trans isomerase